MTKDGKQAKIAYFCMEFGLDESFKIYSGGLGILAGDILKGAKDIEYPLVGVGILWRQGYTTQLIADNGKPMDCFYEYSYDFLEDTGVSVCVEVRGRPINCKVWKCTEFGNAPLYLLDANLSENSDRLITGQLYGWFSEERIAQEMILGIGGVRALAALGIDVDIYHFNDSHPVFAGFELIRRNMAESGLSFNDSWEAARQQIVFTTHTPVDAGNEVHRHELLKYMGAYRDFTYEEMVSVGGDPFSMTVAGLRLSKKANAVSKLHCKTANKMWKHIEGAAKIINITNGVHLPTWQDARIREAFERNNKLLEVHNKVKQEMIDEIYILSGVKLNVDVLTIGFARRAAPYKRSDLIFRNKEIIEPLLKERKLQIIFSGKAHPNDLSGKEIVANLYRISREYPESVVFLQNYDIKIGKMLTRGCDVWLNNPIRPMEASGTSGMKAAMNGVLNLSVMDGWWPEGCIHGKNGWQIGDGYYGDNCDKVDSKSLYKVLTEQVIPTYYCDKDKWEKMMTNSIKSSYKRFSVERMLRDYKNKLWN